MGSIVNLAVGKISELLVQEAKFLQGVEEEVESMQEELIMMNSFLVDMDDESSDERLRNTAKQIRRIAYDAEDVIESYILEVITPLSNNKNDNFIKRYLIRYCKCLVNTHKAGAEIEVIKKRIIRTMEMLKRYRGENGLTKNVGEGQNKTKVWRPTTYSHCKEDHVVGLDEDISKLVGSLTSNESQMQVLSIVGIGGSGKTTLVRKLFNHESVKQYFDSMTWVPISKDWGVQHGLIDIFKRISGMSVPSDEAQGLPQAIGEKIYKYLEKKKYLIVLDDVWTQQAVEVILSAFPMGNNGSKIIVTTRFTAIIGDPTLKVTIHEPRGLTAEESWELFRKITLQDTEETISSMEVSEMEALGKAMLKKCKGLPLAIVALAGVLAKKDTLEEWEKVNKAMSSNVMETGRGTQTYGAVKETLSLSYNDLPRDLKPCFLHLGLFPEDAEIPIGIVIRMWIAEGFILSDKLQDGETLEDLARKYMNELIGRCVVRVASRNYDRKAKTIEIHDLMRELCINKVKELDFLETISADSPDRDTKMSQTRRTVVHSYNDKVFYTFPTDNRHLRSLFLFARPNVGILGIVHPYQRALMSFLPILESFKLLRVLNLVAIITSDGTLPKEIGDLILLRYLGLRVTNITELPSSIGNLRNLLTLDYRSEYSGAKAKIPNVLWGIEGIRHIYLPGGPQEDMRFDTLQRLQTLWVGGGGWITDELPKLSISVQKLHIYGITSNNQLEVVFGCPSIKSDHLHSLDLRWYKGESEEEEPVLKNLECIVNSRHLRKLVLNGRIDDSLGRFQFPFGIKKLVLTFTKFEAEATLEALGRLPSLKVLHLRRDSYFGNKWTCYEGLFSKLTELTIFDLPNLLEWCIEKGAMRQLRKLFILGCKRLTRLPEGLKSITTLKELEFEFMKPGFYRNLQEGGEDAYIIQDIPVVKFLLPRD